MNLLGRPIRLLIAALFASWCVVGTALWLLSGPNSWDARWVSVVATVLLGLGLWRLSGRFGVPSRPTAGFVGAHAFGAVLFGDLMVFVTYGIEAIVRETTIREVAGAANSLGAEFVFWIWLYLLLAAAAYGSRLQDAVRQEKEGAAEARAVAAEARLGALRGQLNPHFLFNALHGVSALVRRDGLRAERALEQLADLLRFSLDESRDSVVELEEELRFTRTFIELERLALGDRLKVEEDIDPAALDARLPPFSLQVLVENAIRHGISPSAKPGQIRIRIADTPEGVALEVEDDGPGPSASVNPGSGRGLSNLGDRLVAHYGSRARLDTGPRPGGGYRAKILVPRS